MLCDCLNSGLNYSFVPFGVFESSISKSRPVNLGMLTCI
jgi:hypothetical protein